MTEPAVDPLEPNDPRRLGTYELTGRLGRGGMGIVYLGKGPDGGKVAVKVISPELADDPRFRERFRREVSAASKVERFCTAAVLDAQLDVAPLYVVTQYVQGPTLDQAVRDWGPLRGSDLEGLAVGMATALSAIHAAGLVHRDLKPSNVLLSPLGPRVIDFGIARDVDGQGQVTKTGQMIGTPAFLAPELLRGEQLSAAADVFSWGCVVAYAANGKSPFHGPTLHDIIYKISYAEPALEGLDGRLRTIVEQALNKSPSMRPTVPQLLSYLMGQSAVAPEQAVRQVETGWQQNPPAPFQTGTYTPQPWQQPQFPQPQTPQPWQQPQQPWQQSQPWQQQPQPARPAPQPADGGSRAVIYGMVILAGVLSVFLVALIAIPASPLYLFGDEKPEVKKPPVATAEIHALDDFSKTDSGWPSNLEGAKYENGHWRQTTTGTFASYWVWRISQNEPGQDLLLSAKMQIVSGNAQAEAGFLCFGDNADGETNSNYQLMVRRDGQARLTKSSAGAVSTLSRGAVVRVDDRPHQLQGVCSVEPTGTRLALWVDGKLAFDHTDTSSALTGGRIGFTTHRENTGWDHTVAHFDDWKLDKFQP